MFRFIKKAFLVGLTVLSYLNLLSTNQLSCISMTNQVRPQIVNADSKEPVFYPFSIKTSKCSCSCNNINDPYAKMGVPDDEVVNVKVFNLMSRTNEIQIYLES